MFIIAAVAAIWTGLSIAFAGVWALVHHRSDCATCALPLSEGSDKRYCVGCLVEQELHR